MKKLKKLTILHSNDLHGDFNSRKLDENLLGGISLLSGYIAKVRREEKNVLYTISGDMFRGSLVDSEYKGISTIEIMNMLTPDVASLGNHEIDYGIAHLLFLEKCARFPIINANLYIKSNHTRMFRSHIILEVDGMKILFIGILTQEVLAQAKKEALIGALVDVREAVQEVGKICDSYRTEDIDFTVLLTHIGFEADKQLAELLNPEWGVDIIIGGHSHTELEKPEIVAGIPIVQAASGTGQIGRFDIMVDTDRNAIDSFTWKTVPIDASHCPRDIALEEVLRSYEEATEEKYGRYITRFGDCYTHPQRDSETELGKIFADIFCDSLGLDIMLMGSGSLRKKEMGPIVTYRNLKEMFPYEELIYRVTMTGAQFKRALCHILRPEALVDGAHSEFYQYSKGLKFIYNVEKQQLSSAFFEGKRIEDEQLLKIGLQDYHFNNMKDFIGVSLEETEINQKSKVVATSTTAVVEEWLSQQELVFAPTEKRWIME